MRNIDGKYMMEEFLSLEATTNEGKNTTVAEGRKTCTDGRKPSVNYLYSLVFVVKKNEGSLKKKTIPTKTSVSKDVIFCMKRGENNLYQ